MKPPLAAERQGVMRSDKMTPTRLANLARRHFGRLCRESGQVLDSGVDTLRPGELYLLGHNPGSEPTNRRLMTIGGSLDSLPTNNKNSYLDTTWVGPDVLQRGIIWSTTALGPSPPSGRCVESHLLSQSRRGGDALH